MGKLFHLDAKEMVFKRLFEDYYAPFCLYAKRFIDDADMREDIVSDVFAEVWSRFSEDELKSDTILAYIKMCVKNSCLNYLKHQEYIHEYEEKSVSLSSSYMIENDSICTLDELYKLLLEALKKLPADYRKVFIESFFKGKSQAEIADELHISVKSVGRYKQRAIEFLRQELKDLFPLFFLLACWDYSSTFSCMACG